jgi:hypothetical protein
MSEDDRAAKAARAKAMVNINTQLTLSELIVDVLAQQTAAEEVY